MDVARAYVPTRSDDAELDAAATKMAHLIEEHFDHMGWGEEERDRRVASAGRRINAAVERAKSEESLAIAATAE